MTTIHDIVLGPAKPERGCGDCVACCQVLNIDEPDLVKPADQVCMHCTGHGCAIYDSRPGVCRTWDCLWRRIDTMPLETRPDNLGVVFTIDRQPSPGSLFDRLYFVGRAVADPEALHRTGCLDIAAMLAHGPLPIFVCWDQERRMIYPREALAAAILDPAGPHDASLAAEGKLWLDNYEPFARLADESVRQAAAQGA